MNPQKQEEEKIGPAIRWIGPQNPPGPVPDVGRLRTLRTLRAATRRGPGGTEKPTAIAEEAAANRTPPTAGPRPNLEGPTVPANFDAADGTGESRGRWYRRIKKTSA